MKKNSKGKRITAFLLAVVLAFDMFPGISTGMEVQASGTTVFSEDGIISGFTAYSGDSGVNNSQNYDNLVDGNLTNKWCRNGISGYVEFYSDDEFCPTGYMLTTGNDTASYAERNPKSWTIKGKLHEDDEWTVLARVTDDRTLKGQNNSSYEYVINERQICKYFRFEYDSVQSGYYFQLAELRFLGTKDYKDIAYASLEGVKDRFEWNNGNAIDISYSVKDVLGNVLTEGEEYTAVITKADEIVENVSEEGEYKLTVTAKEGSGYSGKLIKGFLVSASFYSSEDESIYLITNKTGWDQFAEAVNAGEDFSGKTVKMAGDIGSEDSPVTVMTGTGGKRFRGVFDGDAHTLYVNYLTDQYYSAPFSYTEDATIKNLNVSGNITTTIQEAAGLIGRAYGSSTIENCRVSVVIDSSYNGDGFHGGFISTSEGEVSFTECVFDGKFLGTNTNRWSGYIAYAPKDVKLEHCLFAPAEVSINSGMATFAWLSFWNTRVTCSDCYYTTPIGKVQGEKIYLSVDEERLWEKLMLHDRVLYLPLRETIKDKYVYTGENIDVQCMLSDHLGEELISGSDYSISIKRDGVEVDSIKELGEYVLFVNGIDPERCIGSIEVAISVIEGNEIQKATTVLQTGVYYVCEDDLNIDERVYVDGDVTLILTEGKKLTIPKGINVAGGNSLTISGNGSLYIQSCDLGDAGIGGQGADSTGDITINGGNIYVRGGRDASGIGGGSSGEPGSITINGGNIEAYGTNYMPGIGGSPYLYSGLITINGGKVKTDFIGVGNSGNEKRGTLCLSWTDEADTYVITKIRIGSVSFAPGKVFKYSSNSGVVKVTDNIAGKEIVPYPEGSDLSSAEIRGLQDSYVYNGGAAIDIDYDVYCINGALMEEGRDYTAVITDGNGNSVDTVTLAGEYSLTLTAVEGSNFTGTKTCSFTVSPYSIYDTVIYDLQDYYEYKGGDPISVNYTIKSFSGDVLDQNDRNAGLRKGNGFIGWDEIKDKGRYTVIITGKNGYNGRFTTEFTVGDKMSLTSDTYTLNGDIYTAENDVTIDNTLRINDDVLIYINKDKKVTLNKGVYVAQGKTLTLCGEGTLVVKNSGSDLSGGSLVGIIMLKGAGIDLSDGTAVSGVGATISIDGNRKYAVVQTSDYVTGSSIKGENKNVAQAFGIELENDTPAGTVDIPDHAAAGADVEMTVTPPDGCHVSDIEIGDDHAESIGNNKYSFTMPHARSTVKVNYELNSYNVTIPDKMEPTADSDEITAPNKAVYGAVLKFRVKDGYQAIGNIKNGDKILTPVNGVYTVVVGTADVNITGTFHEKEYKVQLPDNAELAQGSAALSFGKAVYGSVIKFRIREGYRATGEVCYGNTVLTAVNGVYSLTVVAEDRAVTAETVPCEYSVTLPEGLEPADKCAEIKDGKAAYASVLRFRVKQGYIPNGDVRIGGDILESADGEYIVTVGAGDVILTADMHHVSFLANGAFINAECDTGKCTDEGHNAALQIEAPAKKIYGDTLSGAATLAGTDEFNRITGLNIGTSGIRYVGRADTVYSESAVAPVKAGSYTAFISAGDQTASVDYTIAKAVPEINAPSGLTAIIGDKLEDITLINPAGNVAGVWKWNDSPETSVGALGTKVFKASFTPYDTADYESVSDIDVSVTVVKAACNAKVKDNVEILAGGLEVDLTEYLDMGDTTAKPVFEINGEMYGCVLNGSVLKTGDETGTVTVSVIIAEDAVHEAAELTINVFIISTKTDATVSAPTIIKGLVYNGKAQALIEPGKASGGTLYYAVTTETASPAAGAYSTEIPTAVDAGTYYVWYKVVADESHYSIPARRLEPVTIAENRSEEPAPVPPDGPTEADLTKYTVSVSESVVAAKSVKLNKTLFKDIKSIKKYKAAEGDVSAIRIKGSTMTVLNNGTVTIAAFDKAGNELARKTVTVIAPASTTAATLTINRRGNEDMNRYIDSTVKPEKWSSSNKKIATLDKDGLLTVHKSGTVKITATFPAEKNMTARKVTIKVKVTMPGFAKTSYKLKAGHYLSTALNKNISEGSQVSYRIENDKIATVNEKGLLKGVAAGTTKVYVMYNGLEYEANVKVK